jgi:hypothetical protein
MIKLEEIASLSQHPHFQPMSLSFVLQDTVRLLLFRPLWLMGDRTSLGIIPATFSSTRPLSLPHDMTFPSAESQYAVLMERKERQQY